MVEYKKRLLDTNNQVEKIGLEVLNKIKKEGYKCYFIGGYIRNKIIKKKIIDIDLVSDIPFFQLQKIFKNIKTVGQVFSVYFVIYKGYKFEIANFRKDIGIKDGRHPEKIKIINDIMTDSLRRDFSINAMYYDPTKHIIYDFHDGLYDLKNKILKFIGEPSKRIQEDYLRIIRAVRFKNEIKGEYNRNTYVNLIKYSYKCKEISSIRLFDEFYKILNLKNYKQGIEDMLQTNILEYIIQNIKIYDFQNSYDILQKYKGNDIKMKLFILLSGFPLIKLEEMFKNSPLKKEYKGFIINMRKTIDNVFKEKDEFKQILYIYSKYQKEILEYLNLKDKKLYKKYINLIEKYKENYLNYKKNFISKENIKKFLEIGDEKKINNLMYEIKKLQSRLIIKNKKDLEKFLYSHKR